MGSFSFTPLKINKQKTIAPPKGRKEKREKRKETRKWLLNLKLRSSSSSTFSWFLLRHLAVVSGCHHHGFRLRFIFLFLLLLLLFPTEHQNVKLVIRTVTGPYHYFQLLLLLLLRRRRRFKSFVHDLLAVE